MYIDTHAHLCDQRLFPRKEEIINGMKENQLYSIINASYNLESSKINLEISQQNKNIYTVVGIHPEHAKNYFESDLIEIENMAKSEKSILAIGEIGLDYYYGKDDKLEQIELFKKQLNLAVKLDMPVCLHIRDAYLDCLNILKEYKGKLNKILFHCYSGSKEFLNELIREFNEKVYFAFGGVTTFKNAVNVAEAAFACPIDKLMFETDAPYLTPMPFRGKCDNEPKFVKWVYKKVAELKEIKEEELEEQVYKNVKNFFGDRFGN